MNLVNSAVLEPAALKDKNMEGFLEARNVFPALKRVEMVREASLMNVCAVSAVTLKYMLIAAEQDLEREASRAN